MQPRHVKFPSTRYPYSWFLILSSSRCGVGLCSCSQRVQYNSQSDLHPRLPRNTIQTQSRLFQPPAPFSLLSGSSPEILGRSICPPCHFGGFYKQFSPFRSCVAFNNRPDRRFYRTPCEKPPVPLSGVDFLSSMMAHLFSLP